MTINKSGWLKDAIAKENGYFSPKGEKLKGGRLTPEQIAEWNGTEAPVVEEQEPEQEEKKAAPKKKAAKKKTAAKKESTLGKLFKK